jgi:hypothetical protein
MTARTGIEITAAEILDSPHHWIGTVDELATKCVRLRAELGITSFMLGGVDESAAVVTALAGE